MPLTKRGMKIKHAFMKQYGERGERVFYASINAGKITGAEKHSKLRKAHG